MAGAFNITIFGAGATGALLAGRLAATGSRVTLIARGASLEAIRRDGIRIDGPADARIVATVDTVAAPGDPAPPADLLILMVKSYHTASAAPALSPLLAETGHVLCLQNGIDNEGIIGESVGPGRVMPGVLYVGCERTAPGVVACTTEPRIVFGRGSADDGAPVEATRAAFADAGIDCTVEPDILAAKWQKFLFNCGLNPLTALTGLRLGAILADADGRVLFEALVDEALAAAAAGGAPVDAGTRERVMETGRRMDISSSMAEDLAAGRPLELEAFSGYVRRLGAGHGMATPVTDDLYRLLKLAATARVAG